VCGAVVAARAAGPRGIDCSVGETRGRSLEPVDCSLRPLLLAAAQPATVLPAKNCRAEFEALLDSHYRQLLTHTVNGTPVFTVLFDPNGRITHVHLELSSRPPDEIPASRDRFRRFGIPESNLQYVWTGTVVSPANTIVVILGGADSRAVSRSLLQARVETSQPRSAATVR